MRHKLNLNVPSAKFIAMIGLLVAGIPAILSVAAWLLGLAGIQPEAIEEMKRISLIAGAFLAAAFAVLLAVEQIQDRMMDTSYHNNRHRKIRLSDGYYECQYCGSQKVRASDRHCPVCGKGLNEAEEA
jgi:uncharacterized paraquat-inducible protein A